MAVKMANHRKFQFNFTLFSIVYNEMMATLNSTARLKLALVALFLTMGGLVFADRATDKMFASRADAEFHRAQSEFLNRTNAAAAWEFGRACFDLAEFATNNTTRATIAKQGIAACRQAIAKQTDSVPAHYYLGMNLGQLAQTEFVGALKLVREMEREFKIAANLDKSFDYAGPERNLGLLYREAPGWPWSIGSRRKAQTYLEQAVKLSPNYPENVLNLAESCLRWNEPDQARTQLDALNSLWANAQKTLAGPKWEPGWEDWSARRQMVQKKLDEGIASKPSKSTH
jgi:tetratricopeptide (TPR) repeat protein